MDTLELTVEQLGLLKTVLETLTVDQLFQIVCKLNLVLARGFGEVRITVEGRKLSLIVTSVADKIVKAPFE